MKRADTCATSIDDLENLWGFHASRASSTVDVRTWRRPCLDGCKEPLQRKRGSLTCDTPGLPVYHHSIYVIRIRCIYEISTSGASDTAVVAQHERNTKRIRTPIHLGIVNIFSSTLFSSTRLEKHFACRRSPGRRRIIQAICT